MQRGKFNVDYNDAIQLDGQTEFTGYTQLNGSAKVVALFRDSGAVDQLEAGDNGMVVLDQTPFLWRVRWSGRGYGSAAGIRSRVWCAGLH